jgi:putative dimethyl sulfoxide reductase chaperone
MTNLYASFQMRALSLFFAAKNRAELEAAYTDLTNWVRQPAPVVDDWQAVEFSFNRLFVGPKAPVAPPFASVYLEAEPQLMGASTMRVREIYQLAGLQSPLKNKVPEDHISYELDCLRQFSVALNQIPSNEMSGMRDYLLSSMQRWLPLLIQRIRSAENVHAAILFVVDCLDAWLAREVENGRF